MALFDDYYERTPEDEKKAKKPAIRRAIEKGFKRYEENLEEQKEKAEDELEAARKSLSSGDVSAIKTIELSILTISEIDLRIANIRSQKVEFVG